VDAEGTEPLDLERLRRGDVSALAVAYRRFGARIQRTCLGLLGNAAEAEDAAQDVFLLVLQRAHQFDGAARFSTWLYRLTVNHCLHRIEKERLRSAAPIDEAVEGRLVDPGPGPVDGACATDAREVVLARLSRLSAEHRAVLVLREIDGLSYLEIAGALDVPEGTVMSRLARARERWIELGRRAPARIDLEEQPR
jgi:RNA polymerase sigma-70 factor (ECF subfamily)